MSDNTSALKALVWGALEAIAREKGKDPASLGELHFERPKQENHGDWATNAAMQNCRPLGCKPRDLAEDIARRIGSDRRIRRVEVAGPGFINFYLSNLWMGDIVRDVLAAGSDYGRVDLGKGRKAQVEFVSANPTGPLHVGHGRGAAVGDVTGNILSFAGWNVEKEYYVNDAGLQMNILGRSTQSRYFELLGRPEKFPFPEESYKGRYIYDIAQEVVDARGEEFLERPLEESLPFFRTYAAGRILEQIKNELGEFGVTFDNFFSEKSLYDRDLVAAAVQTLKERGHLYEQDEALWFRSTEYGDDKDRVLMRSNGVPTYFTSDIAYHKEKFDRGFERVIDVWGADHHGYVPRMKAAIEALGYDPKKFTILLIQFVNLLRDGEQVKMSTRSGQFVELQEVVREVGVDAARYYFLMRRSDSHLDFDLELAKSQSADNPVYYVQYAHARLCSILQKAAEKGIAVPGVSAFDPDVIATPEEKRLFTKLAQFPEEVGRAAADLEPHRIVSYVYELAGDFHSYYNNGGRILEESGALRDSHLLMVAAIRTVIANALRLLGISAPEKM
ncbi:arginine--tRNA ligase [Pyramidobacter piscolens W5455]|mgnify:CR=1 FL=1|uniref:Arginine--tRNA ligase n=3 Tax=Pyramidobacter piscolens TaxID=638849 RepID=A0ABP2HT23_9BACT|nr:arginine--tRNA ligase [Pyramidobacter piscolens]EFB90397.1 arginine--tRNA ligase [Pyramidobacter piscolens W5455]